MFTGIVACTGVLKSFMKSGNGGVITVKASNLDLSDVKIGDSIACNGVCLTVIRLGSGEFSADISFETMSVTTFKKLEIGKIINLEKALRADERLGGHIVQGHVDGIGTIKSVNTENGVSDVWIETTPDVAKYIAEKGSITIDGISLTVNDVQDNKFRLTLIPHTGSITTASYWAVGQEVNIEADVLARYIERLLSYKIASNNSKKEGDLTMETLLSAGF